jgi:hypothetical protein
MTVTTKHVEPESVALRELIPEGPLCFHEPHRARREPEAQLGPPAAGKGKPA